MSLTSLPTEAKARKAIPIYSGFIKYFPLAIAAKAELSRIGNDQHNPGKPLHWDRSKSGDELDAAMRHLADMAKLGEDAVDTDGVYHATKAAWRLDAFLEKLLEKKTEIPVPLTNKELEAKYPNKHSPDGFESSKYYGSDEYGNFDSPYTIKYRYKE